MLESEYPYTSAPKNAPSTECLYSESKATNVKVRHLKYTGYTNKMKATLQTQPVDVAISANNIYIHSYASGIIDQYDCATIKIFGENLNPRNHAVLIVGYGTDQAAGLDYVLVKNSWNTTWGD